VRLPTNRLPFTCQPVGDVTKTQRRCSSNLTIGTASYSKILLLAHLHVPLSVILAAYSCHVAAGLKRSGKGPSCFPICHRTSYKHHDLKNPIPGHEPASQVLFLAVVFLIFHLFLVTYQHGRSKWIRRASSSASPLRIFRQSIVDSQIIEKCAKCVRCRKERRGWRSGNYFKIQGSFDYSFDWSTHLFARYIPFHRSHDLFSHFNSDKSLCVIPKYPLFCRSLPIFSQLPSEHLSIPALHLLILTSRSDLLTTLSYQHLHSHNNTILHRRRSRCF
jgi:hypothetical protein